MVSKRIGWIIIGSTKYWIHSCHNGWRAKDERGTDCGFLGADKREFLSSWGHGYEYSLKPEKCGLTLFLEKNA